MKLNRIITLCTMAAALTLSVSDVFAQQDTSGNNNNNGGQGNGNRWPPGALDQPQGCEEDQADERHDVERLPGHRQRREKLVHTRH